MKQKGSKVRPRIYWIDNINNDKTRLGLSLRKALDLKNYRKLEIFFALSATKWLSLEADDDDEDDDTKCIKRSTNKTNKKLI